MFAYFSIVHADTFWRRLLLKHKEIYTKVGNNIRSSLQECADVKDGNLLNMEKINASRWMPNSVRGNKMMVNVGTVVK